MMQTNIESDAALPAPHFNEEATVLSARPVVPLTAPGNDSGTAFSAFRAMQRAPLVQRFLPLALIVAAAVGIGIAGGLALSRRHLNRTQAASAVIANQPASPATVAVASQSDTPTPAPDATSNATTSDAAAAREKEAKPQTQTDVVRQSKSATTNAAVATPVIAKSDKRKQTNVEAAPQEQVLVPPTTTRSRKSQEAMDTRDEAGARQRNDDARAQHRAAREERRRAQQATPKPETQTQTPLPRHVERATQQLNRIKEIFEGQKP